MPPAIKRDTVSGEALFILKNLRENIKNGRSNKLAEVKAALEPSVSLEFDRYFFFLRKFHYIAMDREAQLKLTDNGERVVEGDFTDKFDSEVGEFFEEQLLPQENTDSTSLARMGFADEEPLAPPPPPEDEAEEHTPPPEEGLHTDHELSPPRVPGSDEPIDSGLPLSPALNPSNTSQFGQPMPPSPRSNTSAAPAVSPVGSAGNATADDGRYVRFDAVGSGPLGTAFKGRQNALGLEVCLKELKDIFGYFSFLQKTEVLKRLKKELCAQAAVRHPGVVSVLDQSLDGSRPYFVMELCKGSLRERLDQADGKGLAVPQTLRWFLQLAYGLRAAHQQGLVHQNLKPENVLFDAFGNAKVADFGLARVIEVDQTKGMPQVFVGTGGMAYAAPEVMNRTKVPGPSADVYALGILLYEMLTGQLPGRRSPMPSEVNHDIPSKLDPIFDKMTQDRNELRYQDFDAVLTDFYGAFSDGEYLHRGDLVLWSEAPKA
ncbi:MAG: protein kinase [Myxococcota bacterium]|nr:protein kinase [Myxococcota bacterium]